MDSDDASRQWADRYREVVQSGMPGGDVQRKLELAAKDLDRARRALEAGDPDLALIMAEAAMVSAADAVLAKDGYRLRGKTESHEARFAYPRLPQEFAEHMKEIRVARRWRNVALYDRTDVVGADLARDVTATAEQLIEGVRRFIG